MIPDEAVDAAMNAWSKIETRMDRGRMREALEAAAPHLMASVSTLEELDALPRFSVIRSDEGVVFERQTMWHEAGSRDLMYSPDIALPATVLQLGWGEE